MPNGTGAGTHWKDWLLGFTIPTCIALVGIIWNQADQSTVQLDLDARNMKDSISMINQDIAVIKQQVTYINKRLDEQEGEGPRKPGEPGDYRRR